VKEQIKVYIPTLKMVEKVLEVDHYIEKVDINAKAELTEKERSALRKSVREEYRQRIKDLEFNILAYQDLLLQKEERIRACALNCKALREEKAESETHEIVLLKEQLAVQIREMQETRVKAFPVNPSVTNKVYKKLEHINSQYDSKLSEVKAEFSKKTTELVNAKDEEIIELQRRLKKQ